MGVAVLILSPAAIVVAALLWMIILPRVAHRRDAGSGSGTSPAVATPNASHGLQVALEGHIRAVASHPHNVQHPDALEAAARYIEEQVKRFGLTPLLHVFEVDGVAVRNIEIVFEPASGAGKAETIVAGAHYDADHDSPGAHDNGTGVAALLEITRALALDPPATNVKRLRIVFFVNEEQPYGKTPDMGSWRHAMALKDSGEKVGGMIALETLGYFSMTPGSQKLPFPFNFIYPNAGYFIAFVGLPGSRRFLSRTVRAFRSASDFPSTGTCVPDFIAGADLSDHWAYRQAGFAAIMATDTAIYRNPFYHQTYDRPDTVNYAALAEITLGLEGCVRQLIAPE